MAVTNIRGQQILNGTVQYVDIQNVTANTVLANNTASATTIQEVALANNNLLGRGASSNISAITAGTGLEFSTTTLQTTANLRSLHGLTYASAAFVKMTAANTFSLDTNTYLTQNEVITFTASGDVSGSSAGGTGLNPSLTLATITQSTGSNFVKITLDTKGRVTGNTTVSASDLHSTFGTQGANLFYASPNGLTGNPSFRAIAAADIPTLNQNTTGSAGSVANTFIIRGDSGTTEGTDIFTYNGSAAKSLNLAGGSNISITKVSGTFTFAATGLQASSTNLTSLAGLSYASASFVKMTAANTFSLDTTTYTPTARTTSTASVATSLTPDISTGDVFVITAQANSFTVSNPTGTPYNGQKMIIRIKDNGTARSITSWGSVYRASSDLSLPSTTTVNKTLYIGFIYNSIGTGTVASPVPTWDLIAKLDNFA